MHNPENWEEKYRPRHFGAVMGQRSAVDQLSNLIRSENPERHILLTGAVGSGKTSMAEVVARALNCLDRKKDGSPCDACHYCDNPKLYYHEYDAAGRSTTKEIILNFVEGVSARYGYGQTQVVFIDEAHALSRDVQDSLLIPVQKARKGLIFIFATTEKQKIIPALRSRCLDIAIHELERDDAVNYLQFLAESEQLSFEPAALRLLAAARPPYARDLVVALHGLSILKRHIDIDLVKSFYDLGVCDHLVSYVMALADGDKVRVVRVVQDWKETALEKRRWIELFICSTYYNHVLGSECVVNRVIECLSEPQAEFAARIKVRFDFDQSSLAAYFESIMEFFAAHPTSDEAHSHLILALFTKLADRASVFRESTPVLTSTGKNPTAQKMQPNCSDSATSLGASRSDDSRFLHTDDVRQIVNRSSFFVQHYGTPFNAYIAIELCDTEPDLEGRSSRFLQSLVNLIDGQSGQSFNAVIGTLERDGKKIVARLLAAADFEQLPALKSVLYHQVPSFACVMHFTTSNDARDMTLQGRAIRDMCAGCASLGSNADTVDVRRSLKIAKKQWRTPGPLSCTNLYFSKYVSDGAIEVACYPEMPALSPLDRAAFDWIAHGWELREYHDRSRERDRRIGILERLEKQKTEDAVKAEAGTQKLLGNWRQPAENRMRRWRGWW